MCVVNVFVCGSNKRQNSLRNHCSGCNLGKKPREGKNCPSRKVEVFTRQREGPTWSVAGELSVVLIACPKD